MRRFRGSLCLALVLGAGMMMTGRPARAEAATRQDPAHQAFAALLLSGKAQAAGHKATVNAFATPHTRRPPGRPPGTAAQA